MRKKWETRVGKICTVDYNCCLTSRQFSATEWKGQPGAGMHHGPCSVPTDLSADLGVVETVSYGSSCGCWPTFKTLGAHWVPSLYHPSRCCRVLQACNARLIGYWSKSGIESVISHELVNHLVKNSLLNDSQHGFRKGLSCSFNLLSDLLRIRNRKY